MQNQTQMPVPMLHNTLTVEEVASLREKGLEPLDFAAMIGAAVPVHAQSVKDPGSGEHMIIINLVVAVPERILSLKFGGIIDPHTKQTAMDSRMTRAFVTHPPPMFRLLVSRDVLAASEQDRLRRLDVPADIPLPTLNPREEP